MKRLLAIIFLLCSGVSFAQGFVTFTNANPTRFYSSTTQTTLAPVGYGVALIASTSNVTPTAFSKTCIQQIWQALGTDPNYHVQISTNIIMVATAGRVTANNTMIGIPGGTVIFYFAVLWNPAFGGTFTSAVANGNSPVGISVLGTSTTAFTTPVGSSLFGTAPLISTPTVSNLTNCPASWDPLQLVWD